MRFFGGITHHRVRSAFAGTDGVAFRQIFLRHRQYVTLLRFVRPDGQRAHARLVVRYVAQFELTATATVVHQFREGVGNTAGADVVNKGNRVVIAQLPAAVDDFLTTAFHFRVFTLYGGEIQIGIGLARRHRRCRTAAQTNLHGRATQHDQAGADRNLAFLDVFATDVAVTAGNHDWLVVTAYFAGVFQFESTEVTAQVRTAKCLITGSSTQRAVDHAIERRGDAVRHTVLAFPRVFGAPIVEVRDAGTGYAGFWLGTTTGGAFV